MNKDVIENSSEVKDDYYTKINKDVGKKNNVANTETSRTGNSMQAVNKLDKYGDLIEKIGENFKDGF